MEQVYLLKPDPAFAKKLDGNCQRCLDGHTNNTLQIRILEQRRLEYPEEKEFADALLTKCQACFEKGQELVSSITFTHSCMYEVGILPR